jgi:membrane fusion protein (multidrug efflux system)
LDPIEVEFAVTEVDSGRVAIGQTVEVRLAPFPDESFLAEVSFVSPTIDPATRTLRVKAELANPRGRLRPGLFARIDLGVSLREHVPMVPEEAILQRSDGAVVFRVDGDDRASRVLVKTGQHQEGFVEIVLGVEIGDLIVSRGQSRLADGQRIVPRNPDGTLLRRRLPAVGEPLAESP